MRLPGSPVHLAYCTNIHPAETWAETFETLQKQTLKVRERVTTRAASFAIGLRLSDLASRELLAGNLSEFKVWLARENCYIFTINGFPFGQFHGTRVKERVYLPDWRDPARVEYTVRLFEILAALLPEDVEGSVSTLPGSFKEFELDAAGEAAIYANVWKCASEIARISEQTGRHLHLGFEPEPIGWFETSGETVRFFEQLRNHDSARAEWFPLLGVNYDTCHLAIEFEEPEDAITAFEKQQIRLSKIHLSSAIATTLNPGTWALLEPFVEPTYLHQVVIRTQGGALVRYRDLPEAKAALQAQTQDEARIHFHVPLHWRPEGALQTTFDHAAKVCRMVKERPSLCAHLEIETYTWGVLPLALRSADVAEQIEREYEVILDQF